MGAPLAGCLFLCFEKQLVYKVKVSCVLERLLLESVGSDGQAVWLELLVQAKETLDKIKVCVSAVRRSSQLFEKDKNQPLKCISFLFK